MAIPSLTDSYIDETYPRIVQTNTFRNEFADGLGNPIPFLTNNTATGSYGSFYDTGSYFATSTTTIYSMSLSTTDISNGVYISGSSNPLNTYLKFTNAGVYNIQFSAQFSNTDQSGQDVSIWLRKNDNSSVNDLADTNGIVTVPPKKGNVNGQIIASWNYFVTVAPNDYIQLLWHVPQANVITLETIAAGTNPTHPRTPSVILTANRVDQFLSNTGSFTGSFTGQLIGTASWATNAQTASYVNTLNQAVTISGSLNLSGSLTTNDGVSVQTLTASVVSASQITGSLFGTASWANNSLTASYVNPLHQTVQITGSIDILGAGSTRLYFNDAPGEGLILSDPNEEARNILVRNTFEGNNEELRLSAGRITFNDNNTGAHTYITPRLTGIGDLYLPLTPDGFAKTLAHSVNGVNADQSGSITLAITNPTTDFIPINSSGVFQDSLLNQSPSLLKTTTASVDTGLYLDFANGNFGLVDNSGAQQGVWVNDIYGVNKVVALGFNDSGKSSFVLNTDQIQTYHNYSNIGLNLDFANKIYQLGDYNTTYLGTSITIDDTSKTVAVTGSLDVHNGNLGLQYKYVDLIITSDYTIADNDPAIIYRFSNDSLNDYTVTLPDPSTCPNRVYYISRANDVSSPLGLVTLAVTTGNIEDKNASLNNTYAIGANQKFQWVSDGSNWLLVMAFNV